MNQPSIEQWEQLLDQADALEAGPAKLALLEEACAIADLLGDIDRGYETRQEICEIASDCGFPDKLLVAFAWALGQNDRYPERFDEWDLLWRYKWAIAVLPKFPSISREKIENALADMARRYEALGEGERAILNERCGIAWDMGDRELSDQLFKEWKSARRDSLTNCPACERNSEVMYLKQRRDFMKAFWVAKPILSGNLSCHSVPRETHEILLLAALETGRHDMALDIYRASKRELENHQGHVAFAAEIATFLVCVDQADHARRLLERYLNWAVTSPVPWTRFLYLRALRLLLLRYQQLEKTEVPMTSPSTLPWHRRDRKNPLANVLSWAETEARSLAEQFDRRNGNEHVSNMLTERDGWLEKITRLEVS